MFARRIDKFVESPTRRRSASFDLAAVTRDVGSAGGGGRR
jgi:hypothetical protein